MHGAPKHGRLIPFRPTSDTWPAALQRLVAFGPNVIDEARDRDAILFYLLRCDLDDLPQQVAWLAAF
jgi:hypothetical protein